MEQILSERQERLAKGALWLGVLAIGMRVALVNRPANTGTELAYLASIGSAVAAIALGFVASSGPASVGARRLRVYAVSGIILGLLYWALLTVLVFVHSS